MKRSSKSRAKTLPLKHLTVCLAAALGAVPMSIARSAAPSSTSPASAYGHVGRADLAIAATRARRATSKSSAPAGDFHVDNCDDAGAGSLRDVAAAAPEGSSINLARLPCSTITLATGAINFLIDSVTLFGPGADRLTIVGNGTDRIFGHAGGGTLTLEGLTLANGSIVDSPGGCVYSAGNVSINDATISGCRSTETSTATIGGGAIYTRGDLFLNASVVTASVVTAASAPAYGGAALVRGDLAMNYSTIANNAATGMRGDGGGVVVLGDVAIRSSTISGNHAFYHGGLALFSPYSTTSLQIDSTTVSGNIADGEVGGLIARAPTHISNSTIANNSDGGGNLGAGIFLDTDVHAELENSIVSGNFSGTDRDDIGGYQGSTVTGSNDLIMASTLPLPAGTLTADPLLAPLSNNGGRTFTHALRTGSPALDAGIAAGGTAYDQRADGFARNVGAAPDIGAYEVQSTGVMRVVYNCADDGPGSLRATISAARSGDMLDLTALTCGTIALTSGSLRIDQSNLDVRGPGPAALAIDGGSSDRIIAHDARGTLRVQGVTLTHGYLRSSSNEYGGCIRSPSALVLDAVRVIGCDLVISSQAPRGLGGAIFAHSLSLNDSVVSAAHAYAPGGFTSGGAIWAYDVALRNSAVSGNLADQAGGVAAYDYALIEGSTISDNHALFGAGLYVQGAANVRDSTISGNSASANIGGVYVTDSLALYNATVAFNSGGTRSAESGGVLVGNAARIQSSILFGNSAGAAQAYDIGTIRSDAVLFGSHDLVGVAGNVDLPQDTIREDPRLASLAYNGGLTRTHALLPESSAIDAGNNALALSTDQRGAGFARAIGAAPDIGAFESGSDLIFANGFDVAPDIGRPRSIVRSVERSSRIQTVPSFVKPARRRLLFSKL